MNGDYLSSKREQIAEFDRQIFELLRHRTDLATCIGEYKAEHGLAVHDKEQEKRVIERYRQLAEEYGVDPDRAEELCKVVMQMAIDAENAVAKD